MHQEMEGARETIHMRRRNGGETSTTEDNAQKRQARYILQKRDRKEKKSPFNSCRAELVLVEGHVHTTKKGFSISSHQVSDEKVIDRAKHIPRSHSSKTEETTEDIN
jgi:hypothetical protein